ncbi:hypothetical protein D3C81_2197150 [compost metagenome]
MLFTPFVFLRRQGVGHETTDAVSERLDIGVHPGRAVIIQHGRYLEFLVVLPSALAGTGNYL